MTKMQLQLKSAEVQLNFDGPYWHPSPIWIMYKNLRNECNFYKHVNLRKYQ